MEERKKMPLPKEEPHNWNPRPGEYHEQHEVNMELLAQTHNVKISIHISKNCRDLSGHLYHCTMHPEKGRAGEGYGDTLAEAVSRAHWDVKIDDVKDSRYNS